MDAKGAVHQYGDDVNTDVIIPARYLNTSSHSELAAHCMEDIDEDFVEKVKQGDIVVAKKNFGCGSSREHAPHCAEASGVSCVIASTFARILSNSINIGLPILGVLKQRKRLGQETLLLWILTPASSRMSRRGRPIRPTLFAVYQEYHCLRRLAGIYSEV